MWNTLNYFSDSASVDNASAAGDFLGQENLCVTCSFYPVMELQTGTTALFVPTLALSTHGQLPLLHTTFEQDLAIRYVKPSENSSTKHGFKYLTARPTANGWGGLLNIRNNYVEKCAVR